MTHQPHDDLTDVYETLVDWPKRLSREGPFYRRLFADYDVQRIADVACGTGHHAAMFHNWDLQVEGSDVSPSMIERARESFGEPDGLQWTVRGFETVAAENALCASAHNATFDAAICVGNSLALAPDHHNARLAVHQMLAAVRPSGIVVVHVLNLWSLPDGPCVWQKCIQIERDGRPAIVTKGIHRSGLQGYVDLVISSVAPPALLSTQSIPLLGLTVEQLNEWAHEADAATVSCHGDYYRTAYDQETSPDLILVIQRNANQQ